MLGGRKTGIFDHASSYNCQHALRPAVVPRSSLRVETEPRHITDVMEGAPDKLHRSLLQLVDRSKRRTDVREKTPIIREKTERGV